MRAPAFVLGYHGCDRDLGEDVLAGKKHLRSSDNDYDWLGSGIYFWENSSARALGWARAAKANPKLSSAIIKEPFVVGAIIDLGNCWDLMETESIRIVGEAYQRLVEAYEQAGAPLPQNRTIRGASALRHLDCAVVNYAHLLRETAGSPPFDSVRAAFFEGEELYPHAGFQRQTHIQLCLRNEASVIAYFRPLARA